MAKRRMLSLSVIESGKFLKMALSSQALYMHLVVHADDDGVVEAYSVMALIGCQPGDLEILITKGFVTILRDEDLIAYINDWLEMNTLRADRKIDSKYKELLLKIIPDVNILESKQRADRKPKQSPKLLENNNNEVGRPKDRLIQQQHNTSEFKRNNNNTIDMGRPNDVKDEFNKEKENVVVDFKSELLKMNIPKNSIAFLLSRFTQSLIEKQVINLKQQNQKIIKNPAAWLFSACQNNYDIIASESIPKTKKLNLVPEQITFDADVEDNVEISKSGKNINDDLNNIIHTVATNVSFNREEQIAALKKKLAKGGY